MILAGTFIVFATPLLILLSLFLCFSKNGNSCFAFYVSRLVLFLPVLCSAALLYILVSSDSTISYSALHAPSDLPLIYRISSFWAGKAGSLMLWSVFLSITSLIIGKKHGTSFLKWNLIPVFIISVIIAINNPFRLHTAEVATSINPSLQNIWMIVHPPLIMLSYAISYAALVLYAQKHSFEANQAVMLSWSILIAGIATGAYWSYTELGWGGYWSWDPVENSALATLLFLTSCIHAKPSTHTGFFALSGAVFSLVMGTIFTRSGLLNSIHAYASNDSFSVGPYIFLTAVLSITFLIFIFLYFKIKTMSFNNGREGLLFLPVAFLIFLTIPLSSLIMIPGYIYSFVLGALVLLSFLRSIAGFKPHLLVLVFLFSAIITASAKLDFLISFSISTTVSYILISCFRLFKKNFSKDSSGSSFNVSSSLVHIAFAITITGILGSSLLSVNRVGVFISGSEGSILTPDIFGTLKGYRILCTSVNDAINEYTFDLYRIEKDNETYLNEISLRLKTLNKDQLFSRAFVRPSLLSDLRVSLDKIEDGRIVVRVKISKWIMLLWYGLIIIFTVGIVKVIIVFIIRKRAF